MKSIGRFSLINLLFCTLMVVILICNYSKTALGESEETVQSVEVQLNINEGIYEGLKERIELSVGKVGEKMLISQPLSLLEQSKEKVKVAIVNVFSKVLVGFRIESVNLVFGRNTKIIMELEPLPPLISDIKLSVKINNLNPEFNNFTGQITRQVESEINKIFVGLPVASADWAESIFGLVINYLVERDFPGFECKFSIDAQPVTTLNLELTPVAQGVSEIKVDYYSKTVPTWVFQKKNIVNEVKFELLKGVPVEFLIHYQSKLEKYLIAYLNSFPELTEMGMTVDLKLDPGNKTIVNLYVDSLRFRTHLDARYYVNENNHYGNLQGYIGYLLSDYEVYMKISVGENIEGPIKVGFKLPIASNFNGGFEYELENKNKRIIFNYRFERGDYLGLEIGLDDTPNLALLGIVVNNNLDLELIQFDKKTGIQLLFHFW